MTCDPGAARPPSTSIHLWNHSAMPGSQNAQRIAASASTANASSRSSRDDTEVTQPGGAGQDR